MNVLHNLASLHTTYKMYFGAAERREPRIILILRFLLRHSIKNNSIDDDDDGTLSSGPSAKEKSPQSRFNSHALFILSCFPRNIPHEIHSENWSCVVLFRSDPTSTFTESFIPHPKNNTARSEVSEKADLRRAAFHPAEGKRYNDTKKHHAPNTQTHSHNPTDEFDGWRGSAEMHSLTCLRLIPLLLQRNEHVYSAQRSRCDWNWKPLCSTAEVPHEV